MTAGGPPDPRPRGESEDDPVLRRAADTLREEEDAWPETSDKVRHRVREVTRRARRLVASTADLPGGGGFGPRDRLVVSERVVVDAVRRVVTGVAGTAPAAIEVLVEPGPGGDRCRGVRIDLVVGYGTPVQDVAGRLRRVALTCLAELLGSADRVVDVRVVDVEVEDPWQ